MAKTPSKQTVHDGKVSRICSFPRGPIKKTADAAPRPAYLSDTISGYLEGLSARWRGKIRDRFKERGGKDGRLNKAAREILADSVLDVVNKYESRFENPSASVRVTCDKLFEIFNRLLDETGQNEIPKRANEGGQS